jgi:hypothetical protein
MNFKKTILKLITLFLVVLLIVPVASAHHYRHHWQDYGEDEESASCMEKTPSCEDNYPVYSVDENVPREAISENSEVTRVKLCRDDTCIVGGAGETLYLKNYQNAKNPTYKQLITFLKADKTDELPYRSSFVCSDYAVRVHDNAEAAGIKMGWVASDSANHAWNVVETTDKGIVYIDCTGQSGGSKYEDKIVYVEEGEPLRERYLFKDGGFTMAGDVDKLIVYW